MNDAPPYSPTATAGERGRLPHDFSIRASREDESNAFESLVRSKTFSSEGSTNTYSSEDDGSIDSREQVLLAAHGHLTHAITAPPGLEPPPDYTPIDALAHTFCIKGSFVYATGASTTARYQLMQEFGSSGRPRSLHIRRLMASESRRASCPMSNFTTRDRLRFDHDLALYTMTYYDMRGLRSSSVGGRLQTQYGGGRFGRPRYTKMWLHTRNKQMDSLNPENEKRMNKYGYHAEDEWDKRLLYCIKNGVWEDGDGRMIARQSANDFEILDERIRGQDGASWRRDLLIATWIYLVWLGSGIRWENDTKGW